MIARLGIVFLCMLAIEPVGAQQRDQRLGNATANWGTMPNGWVNHGTSLTPRPTPLAPRPSYGGIGAGSGHYHPGRYPVGFYPGYLYPGYGIGGYGPIGGYGVGYRCGRCFSPYCFDPYCRGTFFNGTVASGLSLNIVAPQIVAGGPLFSAGPVLGARPERFGAASGLPWLDRLRRQQADVFEGQQAAFAADTDARFRRDVDAAIASADDGARMAARARADSDAAARIRQRVAELKPSSQAGRERSDQLIADADRFFSQQQIPKAAQRYRQAISVAPNYPKALFRAAHYFVAVGDYQNALDAYLMALEISRDVRQPGFEVNDLYRGNMLDKLEHVNRLAEAALESPEDGRLLMLVGLTLFYDQQPERAAEFFLSAAKLEGAHTAYVDWYLRALTP